jgi:hypothetical protein
MDTSKAFRPKTALNDENKGPFAKDEKHRGRKEAQRATEEQPRNMCFIAPQRGKKIPAWGIAPGKG